MLPFSLSCASCELGLSIRERAFFSRRIKEARYRRHVTIPSDASTSHAIRFSQTNPRPGPRRVRRVTGDPSGENTCISGVFQHGGTRQDLTILSLLIRPGSSLGVPAINGIGVGSIAGLFPFH